MGNIITERRRNHARFPFGKKIKLSGISVPFGFPPEISQIFGQMVRFSEIQKFLKNVYRNCFAVLVNRFEITAVHFHP